MEKGSILLCLGLALVMVGFEVEGRAFGLDSQDPLMKRGYKDPNDPRNLFNRVYGINNLNYKRAYEEPVVAESRNEDLAALYSMYMEQAMSKRGLRDPNDPRNLFRAIYGYRK
ncbi:uncharacterized protein LOC111697028 [Eurytemora carolleeae]|uniref:uncharacterized protein LOC111697028 n=1 Tax=Eurytemora carolleeae TaxID=1294199 RepID=UPI000C794C1F|nr:uncharacterized protein LOC111697028 [Eurytemora carolleeae]|eukprot:XP_023322662.1 uncharacterized protein LOC111697028 [Eurytemora affinis]